MAVSPNIARLRHLLKNFTINTGTVTNLTSTTATITTANLATISGSSETVNNNVATNNFKGTGDCQQATGSQGESGVLGVFHGSTGRGYYTYQEEVSLVGTINATDRAVICELSKTLPANAKIVSAALVGEDRSDLSVVTVGLYLSSGASVAQGTAVTADVVELIGASVGSAALAYGSSGTDGDTEIFSVANGQDVANSTSVYVCSDGTGNTTTPESSIGSVTVTINYWGSDAPASS